MDESELEKLRTKTTRNIQSAVTVLLPEVSAGADRFPLVEVWDYPDLPEPAGAGTRDRKAGAHLAGRFLADGRLGVPCAGRTAGREVGCEGPAAALRPISGRDSVLRSPLPSEPTDITHEEDRMTITGGSLKEELVTLVEGNPEVAANVIRGWVGEAA